MASLVGFGSDRVYSYIKERVFDRECDLAKESSDQNATSVEDPKLLDRVHR